MVFRLANTEEVSFEDLVTLSNYVKDEEDRNVLVPVEDFYTNQAGFQNDEFFGSKGSWVRFNEEGLLSLIRLMKVPPSIIQKLTEKDLTSKVLNDFLTHEESKDKLKNYRFVIDEKSMVVSGLVSKTYVPYSNKSFIEDALQLFPELTFDYSIQESYIINTNLYLRLLSKDLEAGIIDGRGGSGKDISRIGVQLKNGMTGTRAIQASFFVYRLICKNGLILPSAKATGLVKHGGKKETLQDRIAKNITPVLSKVKSVPHQIETLGKIKFDAERFAGTEGPDLLYEIIPLKYYDQLKRNELRGNKKREFDTQKIYDYIDEYKLEHSSKVFTSFWRDNQNMYDFINIFTEYAQTQKLKDRTKIEEKSGVLANWILKNKKKFA
jgi:hypothetical protein